MFYSVFRYSTPNYLTSLSHVNTPVWLYLTALVNRESLLASFEFSFSKQNPHISLPAGFCVVCLIANGCFFHAGVELFVLLSSGNDLLLLQHTP